MAATLTFHKSSPGIKTGTTNQARIEDIAASVAANSADADFKWQVASSDGTSNPRYVVLKRKDASAGRILFLDWSSAPSAANSNPAILDGAPQASRLFVAFFPAGNVDTASNLNVGSGTIMGDDTGCVGVAPLGFMNATYGTSVEFFYFDSEDGIYFGFANPGSAVMYCGAAGWLVVDTSGVAQPCAMGGETQGFQNFSVSNTSMMPFAASPTRGAANAAIWARQGGNHTPYFPAYSPNGTWADAAVSASDVLTDTAESKAWFVPVPLIAGTVKGGGFALKLRQFGHGPGSTGPFEEYLLTGPVVGAVQMCNRTIGEDACPWVTNFQI